LLGVRAVIAESFERIHRSNLIGMGVLPLHLKTVKALSHLASPAKKYFQLAGSQHSIPGEFLRSSQ